MLSKKHPGFLKSRGVFFKGYFTFAPTTLSQPPVTAALLASTSSSVGKNAFS